MHEVIDLPDDMVVGFVIGNTHVCISYIVDREYLCHCTLSYQLSQLYNQHETMVMNVALII